MAKYALETILQKYTQSIKRPYFYPLQIRPERTRIPHFAEPDYMTIKHAKWSPLPPHTTYKP
ncbi:hypothetical protein L484_018741 [Morus notabilis]|uniref:Uncharacterized protein n=1 Tax=Morus notabilis TaxID=981085 RepID=W9RPG4_9ROSA|nr:hypothetical protein L484_018741 [Morus notabilis]